jgi:hypothetical protein
MSSSVYPYTFDAMARIGNDNVAIDQRNIQNTSTANYNLENFYPACPMNTAIDFAVSQPNVFYTGSHEGGIKGCEIDNNNELKFTHLSRPACKLTLTERPFLTVPYLGRGLGDVDTEFELRNGTLDLNKKTINNTMEQNFSDQRNYPLIDSIQNYVDNTAYVIEDDALNGWQRGGVSAREYARQQDEYKK